MRTRIDRFIEDALVEFSEWFTVTNWLGKERDCVNLFVHRFLAKRIEAGAAIADMAQIRIEGSVRQPAGYQRIAATKDVVIWDDPLSTVWDEGWEPVHSPHVVMEWKVYRTGSYVPIFNSHDTEWLSSFTRECPKAFGYLVQICYDDDRRTVDWSKVAEGGVRHRNRRA
jgi:hypothetical protein